MQHVDVAVIGAGAAGALVSIHLARAAPASRVALVGRGPAGLGVAYSTLRPEHVLNVPAARMSAFPDAPEHFVSWLRGQGVPAEPSDYLPRALYGAYIRDLLSTVPLPPLRLDTEAIAIAPVGRGLAVDLASGDSLEAGAVVLATGLLVPPVRAALRGLSVRAWEPAAFEGLAPDDAVLLLGTGLSMVDAAVTLSARGHRGSVHALSRHGLVPAPHPRVPPEPRPIALPRGDLRAMVEAIRAAAREEEASGRDWRGVVDGIRPVTSDAWASLSLTDRRRFFRHVRAYWDVHRHRMAPEAARTVYALRRRGLLRVHAGRLESIRPHARELVVTWRERGTSRSVDARVARVIDCMTAAGLTDAESPLLRHAQAAGLVRPDPLGLGIETGALGAAIGAGGGASDRLFAIGALRRYERWESTAIPELRAQAAALAAHLGERLEPARSRRLDSLAAAAEPATGRAR